MIIFLQNWLFTYKKILFKPFSSYYIHTHSFILHAKLISQRQEEYQTDLSHSHWDTHSYFLVTGVKAIQFCPNYEIYFNFDDLVFFSFLCFLMEFINFLWYFFLLILTTLYVEWVAERESKKAQFHSVQLLYLKIIHLFIQFRYRYVV